MSQETSWIPCVFELASEVGKVVCTPQEVAVKENVPNIALTYTLTAPTLKGSRRLHLSGVIVGITKADPANPITRIQVRGVRLDSVQVLWEDNNRHGNPFKFQAGFPPIDCSGWDAVKVVVNATTSAQPLAARVGFVSVQGTYY
ncbi:MAG: hypothetical protein ACFFF9_13655 [Candidatus Thorarchaeota archaeon]